MAASSAVLPLKLGESRPALHISVVGVAEVRPRSDPVRNASGDFSGPESGKAAL